MNPITPPTEVTLADGKVYRLRYEHRDLATATYLLKRQGWPIQLLGPEAQEFWNGLSTLVPTGRTNPDGTPEEIPSFDQFSIAVLLFAGILHSNPKLTLEQAQSLINWANASDVTTAVMSAIGEALQPLAQRDSEPAEEGQENGPLPSGNGGAADGQSDATTSGSPTVSSGD